MFASKRNATTLTLSLLLLAGTSAAAWAINLDDHGAKPEAKPAAKKESPSKDDAPAKNEKADEKSEKGEKGEASKPASAPAPKNPAAVKRDGAAKPGPARNESEPADKDKDKDKTPAEKPAPKGEMNDGKLTMTEALAQLREGNIRWASGETKNPHIDAERRKELAENGQKPFATILTCSDSRVPAERLFDQGVGDIFVVRVAGNVAGTSENGTVEYGVEHLETPVLVVLGHTKCGAVAATATKAEVGGNITAIIGQIQPAVDRAAKANPELSGKDLVPAAVKENVWQTVSDLLRRSAAVRKMVKSGELKIVGGVYDIASGKVEWMGEHPWQSELATAFELREAKRNEHAAVEESPKH